MYIGHVGVALGMRRLGGAPLWLLVLAAQGPDWGDALFELLNGGRAWVWADPGWSPHGFPQLLACAALMAGVAALRARGSRPGRAALLVACAYLSHWPCDYITATKPTWPGDAEIGLSLYSHPRRDFALEALVVAIGWALWRTTLPGGRTRMAATTRTVVTLGLLAALVALQFLADVALWSAPRLG